MAVRDLPTFIPLEEAAQRYGLSRAALTRLVEDGKIKAAHVNGGIAVAQDETQTIVHKVTAIMAIRDKLWSQVKHLEDEPISMSQACEKYPEINFASLSRWVIQGYIRTLNSPTNIGRGHKKLLNEADVAYTAAILRMRGKRPGKRVFTSELTPPHYD